MSWGLLREAAEEGGESGDACSTSDEYCFGVGFDAELAVGELQPDGGAGVEFLLHAARVAADH